MAGIEVKAGDAISVYWPDDRAWFDGEVISVDIAARTCEVLYDDGERDLALNLENEEYKIQRSTRRNGKKLIDKVWASGGDVPKQLEHIRRALRDIEQRLPRAGCNSYDEGWWSEWKFNTKIAVRTGDVTALAGETRRLADQLKPSITTAWWTAEEPEWQRRSEAVRTCDDLVSSVEELRTRAIDWARARQLF